MHRTSRRRLTLTEARIAADLASLSSLVLLRRVVEEADRRFKTRKDMSKQLESLAQEDRAWDPNHPQPERNRLY
jgi:type II secretory pathway component PulK